MERNIIILQRGQRMKNIRIEELHKGDKICIYSYHGAYYREYHIASDIYGKKFVVSDRMDIYDFKNFMEVLPSLINT